VLFLVNIQRRGAFDLFFCLSPFYPYPSFRYLHTSSSSALHTSHGGLVGSHSCLAFLQVCSPCFYSPRFTHPFLCLLSMITALCHWLGRFFLLYHQLQLYAVSSTLRQSQITAGSFMDNTPPKFDPGPSSAGTFPSTVCCRHSRPT
jgi:hypothetical protein